MYHTKTQVSDFRNTPDEKKALILITYVINYVILFLGKCSVQSYAFPYQQEKTLHDPVLFLSRNASSDRFPERSRFADSLHVPLTKIQGAAFTLRYIFNE